MEKFALAYSVVMVVFGVYVGIVTFVRFQTWEQYKGNSIIKAIGMSVIAAVVNTIFAPVAVVMIAVLAFQVKINFWSFMVASITMDEDKLKSFSKGVHIA